MWRANNLSCGIHYFKTFEMHDNYACLFTNFTQIWKKVRMILTLHRKFTFCLFLCLIFFYKRVQLYRNEYCVSSFSYSAVEAMISERVKLPCQSHARKHKSIISQESQNLGEEIVNYLYYLPFQILELLDHRQCCWVESHLAKII